MSQVLCVTIRFLDPVPSFHGQQDSGEPEWPPSPLRLFQALVDAAASRWRESRFGEHAQPLLAWLEGLGKPEIVAPKHAFGTPFRLSGPNNDMDVPARKWVKGEEPLKPHRPIDLRTMKAVHSTHIRIGEGKYGDALHYLFALPDGPCPYLEALKAAARSITHLGWGVDMAVGDAAVITAEEASKLEGIRWEPSTAGGTPLRIPQPGTLNDLMRKHTDFLNRVTDDGFRPVPPLREFGVMSYRRQDQPLSRPYRLFELRNTDGSWCRYPHRRLIRIAGMLRHLAIEAMKQAPPRGVARDWVETYVAGHAADGTKAHHQLSYLPLPSVGHEHTNPSIRRVMITAPEGDDALLDHVVRRLAGQQLKPVQGNEFGYESDGNPKPPPILVPLSRSGDGVTRCYTGKSSVWHSFTPMILPGHDDRKPAKTIKLIQKALAQSGIDQPCEFEWGAFSRYPKSYSAHKYIRDDNTKDKKRLVGYIRPDHLLDQTAVHLTLRFHDGSEQKTPVPLLGPLVIGAGRHCGFGLMVADRSD